MSVICGLPNLGPASCIACMFVCMVLVKPGPEKHEIREQASAFHFKIRNIYSFYYLFTLSYVLLSSLVSNQGLFVLATV